MPAVPVLVRPATAPQGPLPSLDGAAARVVDHPGGPLRVVGGPGTGKTSLVVAAVADRVLARGVDPERVLVLTAGRRAAADLRERITARLAAGGAARTVREPLVRTVHSYAFTLLRLQAQLQEAPPPRLLSGPEQDVVVRDLLLGDVADGAARWPARLRPALGLPAFAAELRDLLQRAAERGLGPEDLVALGRRHSRDEWVAAGRFFATYEQVVLLRGSVGSAAPQATAPALDAAELVSAALLALQTDADVLRRESERVRHLVVDDAQHLDPQSARLVRLLGAGADELVLLGDPDQAVFTFRGADPGLLTTGDAPLVHLRTDRRCAPAVRAAVQRLAARLPGPAREPAAPAGPSEPGEDPGEVTVRVFRSSAAEAAWVADRLRRAHLLDGVAWSRMAVVVRSTARSLPPLRRALLAGGVPVTVPRAELPVAQQGAVVPLLLLLRCAVDPDALAEEDTATALLASPLGGADPIGLRRLRRELRRLELAAGGDRGSDELLADVLRAPDPLVGVEPRAARPARAVAALLAEAADAAAAGRPAEEVLWRVWQRTGLVRTWAAAASRGGPAGAQADRDLDAVVALFDAAARYADRLPGADGGAAGVLGFCDYVADQQVVGDTLAPRSPQGEAVAVLTAHAAAGREWDVVAVPGVQEGAWPDLRLRGSLLGVEQLVDAVAGLDPAGAVSRTAPLLADERRLLLVAASRARRRLLVSAVRGEDEQPSRFLDEVDGAADVDGAVDGTGGGSAAPEERAVAEPGRGLALPELVGELRRVVCDDAQPGDRRRRAAAGLARLAAAGVPGASPDDWYGLGAVSTEAPLRAEGEVAVLSPSAVESVGDCPLRWFLGRHGGEDASTLPAVTGSLVHRLAHAVAAGATEEEVSAALDEAWTGVDAGAPWFSRSELARVRRMVAAFRSWLATSRAGLTELAVERDVEVALPPADDGTAVVLRGRVDRVELDADGRPVVVDLKTSKSAISKRAAEEHAQLATYQLAAAHGAFDDGDGARSEPGGARIVHLTADGRPKDLPQPPLGPDGVAQWLAEVRDAARRTAGPLLTATENADCTRCPSRTACPLQDGGRQVPG